MSDNSDFVMVRRPRNQECPKSVPNDPWEDLGLSKKVVLPDKTGHTTILEFDVETTVDHKGCDGYGDHSRYPDFQSVHCGWNVNAAGQVVPYPEKDTTTSFLSPDGDTTIVKWSVSKRPSTASEIPVPPNYNGHFHYTVTPTRSSCHYGPTNLSKEDPHVMMSLEKGEKEEGAEGEEEEALVNVSQLPLWT